MTAWAEALTNGCFDEAERLMDAEFEWPLHAAWIPERLRASPRRGARLVLVAPAEPMLRLLLTTSASEKPLESREENLLPLSAAPIKEKMRPALAALLVRLCALSGRTRSRRRSTISGSPATSSPIRSCCPRYAMSYRHGPQGNGRSSLNSSRQLVLRRRWGERRRPGVGRRAPPSGVDWGGLGDTTRRQRADSSVVCL